MVHAGEPRKTPKNPNKPSQ